MEEIGFLLGLGVATDYGQVTTNFQEFGIEINGENLQVDFEMQSM